MFKFFSLQKIDRWLRFNFLNRNKVFEINLSDCIDEFGNKFGLNGTHPFIQFIKNDNDVASLKKWYSVSENQIQSYCFSKHQDIYFCPWEKDRVRPLIKFLPSHKIGPTPDDFIDDITKRLEGIYDSIRVVGYDFNRIPDNLLRVIELGDGNLRKYIIRDGQHRSSVLSALGHEKIKVCFEEDYFKTSFFFKIIYLVFKLKKYSDPSNTIKNICLENIDAWPHVSSGFISQDDARAHFNKVFYKNRNLIK